MKYLTAFVVGLIAAIIVQDAHNAYRVRRFAAWLETATAESFR